MQVYQSVQILLVHRSDASGETTEGPVRVLLQFGPNVDRDVVDTGIQAPDKATAVKMVADKLGGRA